MPPIVVGSSSAAGGMVPRPVDWQPVGTGTLGCSLRCWWRSSRRGWSATGSPG